jgi:hypothetical protein
MARARLLLLMLLASAVAAAAAGDDDVCFGPIVRLDVFAPDPEEPRRGAHVAGGGQRRRSGSSNSNAPLSVFSVDYAVVAAFGGLPPNATTAPRPRLRLRLADPATACGGDGSGGGNDAPPPSSPLAGAWALAARGGNCSFAAKYAYLVGELGAAGMLLYDDRPGCVAMGASPPPPSAPSADPPPPLPPTPDDAPPALSLDHDRGLALAELVRAVEGAGGVVEIAAYLPDLPPALTGGGIGAAASALALAAMATGIVVWGSLWSGRDRLAELRSEEEEEEEGEEEEEDSEEAGEHAAGAARRRRRRTMRRRRRRPGQPPAVARSHEPPHMEVTPSGAVGFVFIASASLLAIWILRGPVVAAVLTAAFFLGAAQGVTAWLSPLLRRRRRRSSARQQPPPPPPPPVVRVPGWAAGALEGLLGLPPCDGDEEDEEDADGWQALPSSPSSLSPAGGADRFDAEAGDAPAQQPTTTPTPTPTPPACHYHYRPADLAAAFIALAAACLWLAADRAGALWPAGPWWLLHDALAASLLAQLLRALRLPDFRSACALLPLVLLYDVFWVFLQPRLTGGGSVMVDVATSGGGARARPLPLLLRVPDPLFGRAAALAAALPGLPASISPGGGGSLLGFGDVVLPGLLAALGRRLDVERREQEEERARRAAAAAAAAAGGGDEEADDACAPPPPPPPPPPSSSSPPCYLVSVAAAYAFGLALTFAALRAGVGGEGGQPALLYLCPCVLGAFAATAWRRGELAAVWGRAPRALGGGDDEER